MLWKFIARPKLLRQHVPLNIEYVITPPTVSTFDARRLADNFFDPYHLRSRRLKFF